MAPRDKSLAIGMDSLLLHFSWIWVGLVISEDKEGVEFLSDLRGEMDRNGICAAFVEKIPVTERSYYSRTWPYDLQVEETEGNVVIISGDANSLISLSFSTWEYLVIWKVWVTTSEWDFIHSERDFILDSFHGTLIFSHHHSEVPGFENFIQIVNPSKYPEDIYLTMLWFPFIPCTVSEPDCKTLENCSPNASLGWLPWQIFDTTITEWSYSV